MGKTIALKLSEKEEQIVSQLNKQGISNSELLRNALHQYFECNQEILPQNVQVKNNFLQEENTKPKFSESNKGLKQEIQDLRNQMTRTQKQIESEVMKLQRQLCVLSLSDPSSTQISGPFKLGIVYDIHQQVDEFLKKR
ncbi:MAG TPA: hypothetical protein DSN98_02325 [Thermoplasmata archaeon]|jgi:hypothetical protein|nr:MAG TPA: hypothetical protein DSN98_02325 [Thermoplasmata archaeon]